MTTEKVIQPTPVIPGRYVKINCTELCCVWTLARSGRLRPLDVRVWLATREARERRRGADSSRCKYKTAELAQLCKTTERKVRFSLRRLEAEGIIAWGEHPFFISSEGELSAENAAAAAKMRAQIPVQRRFFPMPRRVLRFLAQGSSRTLQATVFAHLVRCVFMKRSGWRSTGACKASWAASVFGLSSRSIVRARRHLVQDLKWLHRVPAPQWYQNANGGQFEVELNWTASANSPSATVERGESRAGKSTGMSDHSHEMSPPLPSKSAEMSGPESKQLSFGNKQPSAPVPHRCAPRARPRADAQAGPHRRRATLAKIREVDLASLDLVMELFEQASRNRTWIRRGWAPADTENERLNWWVAARRALTQDAQSPCGLFIYLVRERRWGDASQLDENSATPVFKAWKATQGTAETTAQGHSLTAELLALCGVSKVQPKAQRLGRMSPPTTQGDYRHELWHNSQCMGR